MIFYRNLEIQISKSQSTDTEIASCHTVTLQQGIVTFFQTYKSFSENGNVICMPFDNSITFNH